MATKAEQEQDEVAQLRARVKDLEAKLEKQGKSDSETTASHRLRGVTDTSDRKVEAAMRTMRGFTLASVEAFRLVADSFVNAAENLLENSRPRQDDDSLRDLSSRFGENLTDSVSNAAENLVDIPARSAERFAKAFDEGQYRRGRASSDDRKSA